MLDLIRRNSNSWLIVFMFAVIIFVFALNFGPWMGNMGQTTSYAAEVNGHPITLSEFQNAYSMQLRNMQNYRPGYTPEQAEADGLKQRVVEMLISKELLAQLGKKNHLSISDAELATFIKDQFFGKDKPFDPELYRRVISSNFHMTEAQFEAQMKRELVAAQMGTLLDAATYVSDDEVKRTFEDRANQVALDLIKINPEFKELPAKEFAEQTLKQLQAGTLPAQLKLPNSKSELAPKLVHTGLFSKDSGFVPQAGHSPELLTAAFSLTPEKPVGDRVFNVGGMLYVARLAEKKGPAPDQFEKEKDFIKMSLSFQRRRQSVEDYVEYLKKGASIKYNAQLLAQNKAN